MKTVTVQNTPCIRQDSESELNKVRATLRNDGIAILIPIYNFVVMDAELHTKEFRGRKPMLRRIIN